MLMNQGMGSVQSVMTMVEELRVLLNSAEEPIFIVGDMLST